MDNRTGGMLAGLAGLVAVGLASDGGWRPAHGPVAPSRAERRARARHKAKRKAARRSRRINRMKRK